MQPEREKALVLVIPARGASWRIRLATRAICLFALMLLVHAAPAAKAQVPVLEFIQPTNSAIFSTRDEIPIVLRGFASNDVFPTADVFANQSKIATVSYCCALCPCAAPMEGRRERPARVLRPGE